MRDRDGGAFTSLAQNMTIKGFKWLIEYFNTEPTTPTNITCDGGSCSGNFSGTVELNASGSTDADGDTIIYEIWYGNESTTQQETDTETIATQDSDSGNDTITARGENCGSECKEDAFDQNTGTKWLDFSSTSWITVQLGLGSERVGFYDICSANDVPGRDPDDWTIEGSNDGSSWTVVDTVTNNGQFPSRNTCYSFTVDNPGNYSYYKMNITQNNGENIIQLSEIYYYKSYLQDVSIYNYTRLGNHTEGNTYSYDTSGDVGETWEKFRARAIDLNGSNTWSSYYEEDVTFTIEAGVTGSPDLNWTVWNSTDYQNSDDYFNQYDITVRAKPSTTENEPEDQDASGGICIFRVHNNGTLDATGVDMWINDTMTDITVKADDDTTYTGSITLGTTPTQIHGTLTQGSSTDICVWADYGANPVPKYINYHINLTQ